MKDSILKKLRKLINHEKSARSIGSLAEAELFAEKIQDLLDQFNLSLSDIDMNEVRDSVGVDYVDIKLTARWQEIFAVNIANLNGCNLISCWNGTKIIGAEIDRLVVIEIWEYFECLGRAFADRYIKQYQATLTYRRKRKKHLHSRRERNSFCLGFVFALMTRFRERHEAAIAASQNSTALIFIGNKLADAQAFTKRNLQTRTVARPKLKISDIREDAFEKGHAAGKSVALTTKTVD